jgi:tripartite-type tricarboxylate transporter receptor subunit TctC
MKMVSRTAWAALCLLASLALATRLQADPVGDFYRGKTMRVIIGYGAGGGYDTYGRIVAEFLGRHIPGNPTIIPQNMAGAGGFVAAAYLYNVAPKDGTYLGSVSETLALDTAIAKENDKKLIDARRLPYIGRLTTNIELGVAKPGSNIKSFEDARTRQIVVGASGAASATNLYPLALNKFGGAKFKMVRGYASVNEILLAAERGEVELAGAVGLPYLLTAHADWILNGKAAIIYQGALRRHRLLSNVPLLPELAFNDEGRVVLRAIASTIDARCST